MATQRGFYPSGAAFEFMPELVGAFVQVERLASQQPDLFQRLNEFQPHVLVGYASVLEALGVARRVAALDGIATNREFERATYATCAAVHRVDLWRAGPRPLRHRRVLVLVDGCPTHGGAHINADWAIVEIVDSQYRPVPPGQLGDKVVITNLANRVQPFIRYEVDDRIALATQPCGCGSRLPRIERIEGRTGDLFWTRDANGDDRMLSGVLLHAAVDAIPEIREWQAIQTERNRIELHLQLARGALPSPAEVRSLVLAKLIELGLPRNLGRRANRARLEHDPATGKRRRMISKVGPPQPFFAAASDAAVPTNSLPVV